MPVVQRLELLNGIIATTLLTKLDGYTGIASSDDLHLHPEPEQELQCQQQDEERLLPLEEDETVRRDVLQGDAMVRGEDSLINENKDSIVRERMGGSESRYIMVRKCLRWREIRKGEDKYLHDRYQWSSYHARNHRRTIDKFYVTSLLA